VEDDYSRAVSGYYLSFEHPNSVNTALALRQAIWRKTNPAWQICGIPEKLYTDNGSDFICEHIRQVGIALKIQLVNSIPVMSKLTPSSSTTKPNSSNKYQKWR